jgi:multidrug efflux pump subunit AcrB
VIAALLPLAFVSGLMGPYMRPIPINASAAMLFSLAVAFVVSPWLTSSCSAPRRELAGWRGLRSPRETEARASSSGFYSRLFTPLLASPRQALGAARRRRRAALAVAGAGPARWSPW